ncbi:MAG: hypothetical protein BWY44_01293 [Candidatus Omnitrophica bacterium ADurb.Bin292]|nr:MAG: hypothetical protein BWY44_01293 [Candidatus Omnitrophica bacterium ADurb.Bin292]
MRTGASRQNENMLQPRRRNISRFTLNFFKGQGFSRDTISGVKTTIRTLIVAKIGQIKRRVKLNNPAKLSQRNFVGFAGHQLEII